MITSVSSRSIGAPWPRRRAIAERRVLGRQHGVAGPLQRAGDEMPDRRFVLDDQDGPRAALAVEAGAKNGCGSPPMANSGGSASGRAIANVVPTPRWLSTRDAAAALGDDRVDGREAEAGALAARLGREVRLEEPRQHVRRHALAGVGETQHHFRRRQHVVPDLVGAQLDARGDAQLAALGHGVAGVGGEVEQHLLDLAAVGDDPLRLGRRLDDQRDVGAEQAAAASAASRRSPRRGRRSSAAARACG